MPTYLVRIERTLEWISAIEADSKEEAIQAAAREASRCGDANILAEVGEAKKLNVRELLDT